jgi:hypothetical protein
VLVFGLLYMLDGGLERLDEFLLDGLLFGGGLGGFVEEPV